LNFQDLIQIIFRIVVVGKGKLFLFFEAREKWNVLDCALAFQLAGNGVRCKGSRIRVYSIILLILQRCSSPSALRARRAVPSARHSFARSEAGCEWTFWL